LQIIFRTKTPLKVSTFYLIYPEGSMTEKKVLKNLAAHAQKAAEVKNSPGKKSAIQKMFPCANCDQVSML
jgi:hypothetical protein